jgi:methylmalonyl-CoA mutase N-terminal domain/subunit
MVATRWLAFSRSMNSYTATGTGRSPWRKGGGLLKRIKEGRNPARIAHVLGELRAVAPDEGANLMPATIAAATTMGEIVNTHGVFGPYVESPVH